MKGKAATAEEKVEQLTRGGDALAATTGHLLAVIEAGGDLADWQFEAVRTGIAAWYRLATLARQ